MLQQRGDVIKVNAGFGEIRHFANQFFEIVHSFSCGRWPVISQLLSTDHSSSSSTFNSEACVKPGRLKVDFFDLLYSRPLWTGDKVFLELFNSVRQSFGDDLYASVRTISHQ